MNVCQFHLQSLIHCEIASLWNQDRVCGNHHAIIRKYGLMCYRQSFLSNAKEIGFIKVNIEDVRLVSYCGGEVFLKKT
ncbi:hypothetical protein MKX03_035706 [Papaver bracteatum]|nr:hypothetical protein MKX03_035706 [Papaver bracteatum]